MVSEAKHKSINGEGFKMLTPKQMLQRLPIALAQVKAGKTSENLLNEIRQIISSIYRAKEIIKKVCNSIMNSINTNMDTIFMKSENSKTSDLHRLSINIENRLTKNR